MPPKQKKQKPKSKFRKQSSPEDFELSDDEPTKINLHEEQKLSSKFITFDCPLCQGKLQLRNEKETNPKSIKFKCNPCSFKISKNDKIMNVSRDDNAEIFLESEDYSMSFSWNRQVTPEDKKVDSTNIMISDVMGTPRNNIEQTMNDMDWKQHDALLNSNYVGVENLLQSRFYPNHFSQIDIQ